EALQALADAGEIAGRRMTCRTAPRAVEILSSRFGVAGLEVGDVHRTARARRLRLLLLIVNERDDRREVGVAEPDRRHPFVGAAVAHARTDLVAADVVAHERRARQVRAGLAAHRVASVAEAALRGEDALAGLQPLRRRRLRRGRLKDNDNAK